jgi:flagellin-like hook-associated protein FlgL
VRHIFLQALSVANTKVENRFLFAGFLNGAAPFAETSTAVNYLGDNGQIFIQTSAASSLPINLLGNQVFQGAGVVNGQGVFDVLRDLERLLEGTSFVNSLALGVNLDAALAAGPGFSPPNAVGTEAPPATWLGEANFSTLVSVFDSKGQAHNLTFLFAKTGANTFRYRVVANSNEIMGGTPGNLYQVAPEGTLAFNPDGSLNAAGSTITNITLNGLANGAADIAMNAANISFAGSTHLTKPSAVLTLAQSNSGAFATQLGRIDAVIDQLLTFRAEVGSRLNSAKVADDSLEVLRLRTREARSNIEDADVLSVYSDFARFKHAFDAALQSASQVLRPSLLDFLR